MARLKVELVSENSEAGNKQYRNKINAGNYKEISLVLTDLRNLGLPIEKALKEYKREKSDWDAALGIN